MGSHWVVSSETDFLTYSLYKDNRLYCRDWAKEEQTGGRKVWVVINPKFMVTLAWEVEALSK